MFIGKGRFMGMLSPIRNLSPDLGTIIRSVDRAIKNDRVTGLAEVLAGLDTAGLLDDPALYAAPRPDRYSRKLVWRDPDDRFVVVGLTWAPGQSSPLHDHHGLWGAEIVVEGAMHETLYELVDRAPDGRYQFVRGAERISFKGAIGVLIPPLEYHDFGNAGTGIARTLHVYGGNLTTSNAFTCEGSWWRPKRVDLRYDE
jgi:3-mercaptopropionate dioxygenase